MFESTLVLMGTAFVIAFVHTAAGPDHYLPFIILGRSEKWSLRKILVWTGVCGLGHILASIVVAGIGVALGFSISSVSWFEGFRASMAAWLLVVLGMAYMLFGIYRAQRGHSHKHDHLEGGAVGNSKTFWALFLVFVLGPCEPLIPLLMAPAADGSLFSVVLVALVFGVTSIVTMLALVTLAFVGVRLFEFGFVHRYMHAFSGFAIALSGLIIVI